MTPITSLVVVKPNDTVSSSQLPWNEVVNLEEAGSRKQNLIQPRPRKMGGFSLSRALSVGHSPTPAVRTQTTQAPLRFLPDSMTVGIGMSDMFTKYMGASKAIQKERIDRNN